MAKVTEFFKLATPKESTRKALAAQLDPLKLTRVNSNLPPDLHFGVEMEVENIRDAMQPKWPVWTAVNDGSLRNHGIEYVSHPLTGDVLPTAIHSLCDALPKGASFSFRTSIHVHVDVTKLDMSQVGAIIATYLPMEMLMYQFAGPSRARNNFCVPMQETDIPEMLFQWMANPAQYRLTDSRYCGLNLDSVRKHGTLEFRHLAGTGDPHRIIRWCELIGDIVTYGLSRPFQQIMDEISMLNTNSEYRQFANRVFKSPLGLDLANLEASMVGGVKCMKLCGADSDMRHKLIQGTVADSPLYVHVNGKAKPAPEVALRLDQVAFAGIPQRDEDRLAIPIDAAALAQQRVRWVEAAQAPQQAPVQRRPRGQR